MKVSCLQENLNKALGIVGRAVASKTTLPITTNILLSTDNGRLRLAATNLEIAITAWIGADVQEDGALAVPARLLSEFVGSLPKDKVELAVSARTRTLTMRCARVEARINGFESEDFPPIPTITEGPTATVDPEDLRQAIAQVVFAAATDESRPVLTGVHCRFEGDQVILAAADGFRLSVREVPLAGAVSEPTEVIVPARTLAELNRALADEEDPVEIVVTPAHNQVLFHLKSVEIVSQLITGNFPNYRQLIPGSFATRTVVNTSSFLEATRRASIFARDSSGIVRIQIAPSEDLSTGRLLTSARAEEVGDNVDELEAVVEGDNTKIAFNAKYLQDVLGCLNTSQVALETKDASSPGVIRPVGTNSFVHVIMPMFVQW
jgi:DNA polymerase-3 subunit beta